MIGERRSIAQRKLLMIWLVASAPPFLIMAMQTLMGRFDDGTSDRTPEAWGWLLPTVMPTLVLVVGTVVTNAIRQVQTDRVVDRFYQRLAAGLSLFYLAMVTLVLMVASVVTAPRSPIQLMMQSNLFLAPVQGLVGAALGVFFVSSAGHGADQASPASPASPANPANQRRR